MYYARFQRIFSASPTTRRQVQPPLVCTISNYLEPRSFLLPEGGKRGLALLSAETSLGKSCSLKAGSARAVN